MPSNNLGYYLNQVERRAGLTVSSSFPSSPTDEQQYVMDCINEQLRYLNNKHYLIFQQTEYTLTTTAGTRRYNLTQAPYSQSFWRVARLARNGVVRVSDEFPLFFVDYTELDYIKPAGTSNGRPTHFSQYGENLVIHPPPDGSQLLIRYYGLHIGTDSTGTTQKLRLSAEEDLPMIADEWEDVLTTGAAMKVRGQQKVDEKYAELKRQFEDWENILIDMGNQPGEDNGPEMVLTPYQYNRGVNTQRFYPFYTSFPGA